MIKKLALALLPFIAACASGPMTIGVPGQEREVKPAPPLKYTSAGEPAFCVGAIPIAYPIQQYTWFAFKAPFRDIRLLTDGHPGPQGCDVLLRLTQPGPAVWAANVVHGVQAYSARTRELLWEGTAKGGSSLEHLAAATQRAFQPGQPAHDLLLRSKDRGRAPTIEDIEEFAGNALTAEADWYGQDWFSAVRVGKARPVEQAAAVAPAPVAPIPQAVESAPARSRSDVDEPPALSGARRGHAIIVGIEQYRGKLPKADYAAADAKTMARYAHAALGFPEANIALLTDETATRSDLVKHFEKWLANRVEKDDEVFVYFSGHGAPDAKTGDAFLVPYDGDPTYLEETGYPIKKLYAALAALPAKKVTVALDSCFSGAGGRSVIARGARPLVAVKAAQAPAGVTVIAAAGPDQLSNTYDEKGHGLFTYFLLKGMKERGSDLRLVFDYLKPEVSKVARREYNADQEPQWREGR